ncbi:DUF5703 family protein [Demequina sp. TTPB684]|uniref:DUF5703 family protein n=1 Tax=unclassified Demequina TaxID=2620311 RepID=UPI001CF20F20|nr:MULTISPECIES: DUF5703 family protein [unclassified Demequina]MCB2413913.1 DUF5703 family protein [Demequina sp. TTPB684]UPU89399.1 DUF5703 family protein [Demequina sp. TMPB413]
MTDATHLASGHVINPRLERRQSNSHTQWRVVDIPRDISRGETTQLLSEQAEYGRWELARSIVFVGGARRVWLRRRTMHVERTDAA